MEAPMSVHCYDAEFSIDRLVADQRRATEGWDWRKGAFGHSLSLPSRDQLHPAARFAYRNYPYASVLGDCPCFREIFDAFQCEKMSFRLLWRPSGTAYEWHRDDAKGAGVARFQIPIVSHPSTFLALTDYSSVSQICGDPAALFDAERFETFAQANAGHVSTHRLEVGRLHYFDTTKVHNLVNAGEQDRITLSFDLVANDWLLDRFPEVLDEVGDSPKLDPPGRRQRSLAFALALLHPLRTRAHRWRRGFLER